MEGGETNVDNEVVEQGLARVGGTVPDSPRALECTRLIESPTGVAHLQPLRG